MLWRAWKYVNRRGRHWTEGGLKDRANQEFAYTAGHAAEHLLAAMIA
jgi:hypothetical protein